MSFNFLIVAFDHFLNDHLVLQKYLTNELVFFEIGNDVCFFTFDFPSLADPGRNKSFVSRPPCRSCSGRLTSPVASRSSRRRTLASEDFCI